MRNFGFALACATIAAAAAPAAADHYNTTTGGHAHQVTVTVTHVGAVQSGHGHGAGLQLSRLGNYTVGGVPRGSDRYRYNAPGYDATGPGTIQIQGYGPTGQPEGYFVPAPRYVNWQQTEYGHVFRGYGH